MGVRAIRARIECDRETLIHLWRTHCVFNERLPSLISKLFAMRRGEIGATPEQRDLYQRFVRFVLARDAKDAPYLLNSISIRGWKPSTALKMKATFHTTDGGDEEITGVDWANEAAALSAQGVLAFDKEDARDGLPDSLFQPLTRDAVAYLSGHDELVRIWRKEHEDWVNRKKEWEAKDEHKKYLALRDRFDVFEKSVGGKAGKRRERWHLYLKWLRENSDLAGWRGGPKVVNALDEKAKARVAKAKPRRQRSVEAEEFWNANPELAVLDRLHGYYEREFVRRRKTKKNPDGFEHRPTFTMPDAVLHPRWVLFNAPQTSPHGYRNLTLPDAPGGFGSVELRLLTADRSPDRWPESWVPVRFRSDPRLAQLAVRELPTQVKKGKRKRDATTKTGYVFGDSQLKCERPAQLSGAKLIFKFKNVKRMHRLLRNAQPPETAERLPHLVVPYLVFACTIDDLPLTERAKAVKSEPVHENQLGGKKKWKRRIPPELVTCAVDLGLRNLGFITLATPDARAPGGVHVLRSRNQWLGRSEDRGKHPGRWSPGPDLAHIGNHKREIRQLRRLRGKPVKGEESHVELQRHITDMGTDRFKKAARAIVNFALNVNKDVDKRTGEPYARADVLLVEKLAGFIPDAERERGINRALANWNRGQLVTRIKEVAKDAGLKLFEVHPAGTSQCCCKCGALGRRYSVVRDEDDGRPVIRFGRVEKLFACTKCGYRANADHNGSVNLHRQFVLPDNADKPAAVYKQEWSDKSNTDKGRILREMENRIRPDLERLHGVAVDPVDEPF